MLYEISSIAAVNNELCGRQGKGRIKRGCINFDTPSSYCIPNTDLIIFMRIIRF